MRSNLIFKHVHASEFVLKGEPPDHQMDHDIAPLAETLQESWDLCTDLFVKAEISKKSVTLSIPIFAKTTEEKEPGAIVKTEEVNPNPSKFRTPKPPIVLRMHESVKLEKEVVVALKTKGIPDSPDSVQVESRSSHISEKEVINSH